MIYILMADGSKGQVDSATTATVEGDELICRDDNGRPIARFDKMTVTAYGNNDAMKAGLGDEAAEFANPG